MTTLRDIAAVPSDAPNVPRARVEDLTVTFERRGVAVNALRGVTLDVNPGEILGLVGESGSGKSVLGLALLGLLAGDPAPAITGSAEVAGVDVVTASRRRSAGCCAGPTSAPCSRTR